MKNILFLTIFFLIFACENKKTNILIKTKEQAQKEEDGKIIKTVFISEYQWALNNNKLNLKSSKKYLVFPSYYDSNKKQELDPSVFRSLSDTFKNTSIVILPLSRMQIRYKDPIKKSGYTFYDSMTEVRGYSFFISEKKRLSDDSIQVHHSLMYGQGDGKHSISVLIKKRQGWDLISQSQTILKFDSTSFYDLRSSIVNMPSDGFEDEAGRGYTKSIYGFPANDSTVKWMKDLIDDSNTTPAYVYHVGGKYTVGDVAFWSLEYMVAEFPVKKFIEVGLSGVNSLFFDYFIWTRKNQKNRETVQRRVRDWFNKNKNYVTFRRPC